MIEKLRMSRIDVRGRKQEGYPAAARIIPMSLTGGALPKEPGHFLGVEAGPANDRAVEKQDGNMQTVAPGELRVRIDVHRLHRRERDAPAELLKLGQHLLAKTAVFAVQERQDGGAQRLG